jgi:hypothetical protein
MGLGDCRGRTLRGILTPAGCAGATTPLKVYDGTSGKDGSNLS